MSHPDFTLVKEQYLSEVDQMHKALLEDGVDEATAAETVKKSDSMTRQLRKIGSILQLKQTLRLCT